MSEPESYLRLRPGAAVYELSVDELQISFPNYTATFTSLPVTKGVAAIVRAVGTGGERAAVVAAAATETGLDAELVDALVDSLLGSRCLVASVEEQAAGPLHEFHSYLGNTADDLAERLAAARCVLVQPSGDHDGLADALIAAGLDVALVPAPRGEAAAPVLEALAAALDGATVLGCWDIQYRSPFARAVNELALAHRVPALFGACEGVVGRVGPYVIPGSSPCLECVTTRLLMHAGGPELRAYREYRVRNDEIVPAAWPAHPLFARGIAALYGVELLQLAMRLPSVTAGGFVEYRVGDAAAERHPVLRVPGCPVCRPQEPRRMAWDVQFPAPPMQEAGE